MKALEGVRERRVIISRVEADPNLRSPAALTTEISAVCGIHPRKNPCTKLGTYYCPRPLSGAQTFTNTPFAMSQHRSLKGTSTIAAKRNVLKRFERVEVLKKRGQFKKGDSPIGLRKTNPDV